MKKSLIALAALAAVGAASAQSSVTMYGLLDIGYGSHKIESRDGTNFSRTTGVQDSTFGGPRIGFRGTEDLGGGLKANFVIEQGLSMTSPNLFSTRVTNAGPQVVSGGGIATATNRQSYIGLDGGFGTVRVGYQYTNFYELSTLSGYTFTTEAVGGAAHLAGLAAAGGSRANGITYISPNFGGFTVRAQYGSTTGLETIETSAAGTNGLTVDNNRRLGLMGQYANGPLSAALAYTTVRSTQANGVAGVATTGATTNVFGVVTAAAGGVLTGVGRTANMTQLGASYDFGVVKLGGTYNTGKNGGSTTSTVSSRFRGYQIGVIVPFGAVAPYFAFGKLSEKPDNAAADLNDIRQVQAGIRYTLSKRTMAFATYGRETNNGTATAAAAAAGYKQTKYVVGLQHAF